MGNGVERQLARALPIGAREVGPWHAFGSQRQVEEISHAGHVPVCRTNQIRSDGAKPVIAGGPEVLHGSFKARNAGGVEVIVLCKKRTVANGQAVAVKR